MSSFLSMSSFPLRNIYLHWLQHCTKDLSQAFDLERRSVRFRPKKEVLQLFRAFVYATVFRLRYVRAHSYLPFAVFHFRIRKRATTELCISSYKSDVFNRHTNLTVQRATKFLTD